MRSIQTSKAVNSAFVFLVLAIFSFEKIQAQTSVEPEPNVATTNKINIDPNKAALIGIVPGLGQLALGNIGSGLFQFGLFVGSMSSAYTLSTSKEYIKLEDRRVTYSLSDALIGYELRKQGLFESESLWLNVSPIPFETASQRDLRMIQDGKLAELNPLLEYGEYNRTNTRTEMVGAYSHIAQSTVLYSIYSSYRDAGGGRQDETIDQLLIAPYQWEYLKRPRVFIPIVVLAAVLGANTGGYDVTIVNDRFMKDGSREFLTVYTSMNAAVAEEAFFRGYLNHSLSARHGPIAGGLISGTLFGFAHLQSGMNITQVLPQTLAGYYFAFMQYYNGGDIREGIAFHFWWDAIIFAHQFRKYKSDRRFSRNKVEVNFMPVSYTIRF